MDSHVWRTVYTTVREVDRVVPRYGRHVTYSDRLIVAMYIWSVEHDRPFCWACDRRNYASCFRPRQLPSVSQFCKRIKTERCTEILQKVHERLAGVEVASELSFLDGRALCVGAYSKDRQAARGPAPGRMAKGYKLHAWGVADGRIPIWSVMPLNVSEKTVAGELLRYARADGLILADQNYDAGWLYDRVSEDGGHLLTPLPNNAGAGHRPQSSARLVAAEAWNGIAGYVYRERLGIERILGHTASFAGGLASLPPWVRGLDRVRRWVGTKLIIYHARLLCRRQSA
jgi:hypothetical protein